jgi:hypothetical protein
MFHVLVSLGHGGRPMLSGAHPRTNLQSHAAPSKHGSEEKRERYGCNIKTSCCNILNHLMKQQEKTCCNIKIQLLQHLESFYEITRENLQQHNREMFQN